MPGEPVGSFVAVRTKLQVPAVRAQWLPRPRLLAALAANRHSKLILVCAPTGWGKTSLLAAWAAACDVPVAWVSLSGGDDEPLRFWRYVAAALDFMRPGLAPTANRRLRSPVVSIEDEILPVLVNEVAESGRLAIVLDDYHVISSTDIHNQIAFLLDHLPVDTHLVMSTQQDPPIQLGRRRAMGEVVELRREDLRFTAEETEVLLNGVHQLGLAEDEMTTLHERIEGWVAGLNLAVLSVKERGDPRPVVNALPGDHRYLVDYLWNEIVLSQPLAVQRFLMRTSVLDRFTGSLCAAATGQPEADQLLHELERANLFVMALDREHTWFRYHHLFRSLLLSQLRRSEPREINSLYRRASAWHADHGDLATAIEYALRGDEFAYAVAELERHWLDFYSEGRANALLGWIDRLPSDVLDAHPVLVLAHAGVARSVGRLEEVEPWLRRAEAAPADAAAPGFATSVRGGVALMRSMHSLSLGEVPEAIALARRAVELERTATSREHAIAGYFLGITLFYEEPDEAVPLLQDFLAAVPVGEQDARRYFVMALLAETCVLNGQTKTADRLAAEATEIVRRRGLQEHPPTEQLHVVKGALAIGRGDLEEAEEQLERAVTLARRGGDRAERAHALVWLAYLRVHRQDPAGGRDALTAAEELVPGLGRTAMRSLVRGLGMRVPGAEAAPSSPLEAEELTTAELRVLRLLPGDLTYREIGRHLYLSLNTVRTHVFRLRRKLGASARSEVVAKARERGLL